MAMLVLLPTCAAHHHTMLTRLRPALPAHVTLAREPLRRAAPCPYTLCRAMAHQQLRVVQDPMRQWQLQLLRQLHPCVTPDGGQISLHTANSR